MNPVRSTVAALAALVGVLGPAAAADARPADTRHRLPSVAGDRPDLFGISDDGTLRVVHGRRLWLTRQGRTKRCLLPAIPERSSGARIGTNGAGALAYAWVPTKSGASVMLTSARPHRCFSHPRAVRGSRGAEQVGQVAVGPHGTIVVDWDTRGRTRLDWGSGSTGGRVARRGVLFGHLTGGPILAPPPAQFFGSDRVVFSWRVTANGGGGRPADLRVARTSDRLARHLGPRRTVARVADPPAGGAGLDGEVATDAHGGQVLVTRSESAVFLRHRGPGRRFGRPRRIPLQAGPGFPEIESNARGDAIVWLPTDAVVYALVRRHNGVLSRVRSLPSPYPPTDITGFPEGMIDRSGRAAIAWAESSDAGAPSYVGLSRAGTRGGFGPARDVSGDDRVFGDEVRLTGNAAGSFLLAWTRHPVGRAPARVYMRGRLG